MRKLILIVFTGAALLQSCSPPPTEPPTSAPTPTSPPTITPTATNTPTITPSPTIVKIPTQDFNATSTPPAFIFKTPTLLPGVNTATPLPTSTPSSPGAGFDSVKVSGGVFYWGVCTPNRLKFTAQVSEPEEVFSVVLFIRMKHLKADIYTDWNKGSGMTHLGNGLWTYTLSANAVDNHKTYRRGWVWYQLVATGAEGREIGRSQIYANKIRIEPCMCLTPPCGPND